MKRLARTLKHLLKSRGYDIVRHKELPELLELHGADIVLDIGVNDGGYATELRQSGWSGPVVSFEPQPTTFGRLQRRFASDSNGADTRLALAARTLC
jgi:hypothetical protein